MSVRASLSFVTAAHAADLKRERDDAREKLRALVEAATELGLMVTVHGEPKDEIAKALHACSVVLAAAREVK